MILLMVFVLVYLLLLAWLAVSQKPVKAENWLLFATTIAIAGWIGTIFGLQTDAGTSVEYARLVFALGIWSIILPTQLISLMVLKRSTTKEVIAISSVIGIAISVLCLSGTGVIDGVTIDQKGQIPIPQYGVLAPVYAASIIAALLAISLLVTRGAVWGTKKSREQMRVVGFSMLAATLVAIATNFALPFLTQNTESALLAPIAALIMISGLHYSIAKQGLFDFKQAAIRTMVYLLVLSTLAGIYFGLAYLLSVVLFAGRSPTYDIDSSLINVISALLLTFLFQPVKHFFDHLTNRLFYHGEYDPETFSREFGMILSYDTDLRLLLRKAGNYIADNLKAESVFFLIVGRGTFGSASTAKSSLSETNIAKITAYYKKHFKFPEIMRADVVESEEVRRILEIHHVYIALPLMLQDQVIGYLFIGEHKSRGYTMRDVRVIESIGNELAIAVHNSLSVEEIRELNESLKHRVDEATREIRQSNRRLQQLDKVKDEFISMASHQLRTPLTSIKGYLDTVLQGDLGHVNSTQRVMLSEAFISSERMVTLINDFLNVSRLQIGKFVIERRDGDLKEVVRDQIDMLRNLTEQHRLQIKEHIDDNVPTAYIDIEKLRQVILNFIDNAIYYSKPDAPIYVSLTKENNHIVFTVKDSGIGVPESEKSQLFSRFFRASNARQHRPDGTGVGLFLAKKVVTLHGGQIIFESEENKGSTFGFRIPINSKKETPH